MTSKQRRGPDPEPGTLRAETPADAKRLVSEARTVHALCMMRRHTWPEWDLTPGKVKTLPKGLTVGPIRHDGLLDITEHCTRDCGEYVTYLVRPNELFGIGIRKNYHRPKDRPVIARELSREYWALPLQQVLQSRIMAAAQRATEAADRATAQIEAKGEL
jgi:hypothetical protein